MKPWGGLGDMANLLKQAQGIKKKIDEIQAELEKETVEVSSGGGMVQVRINGKMQIESIRIEKEAVDPDDVEMLQDLILAAVREGQCRAQEMAQEKLGAVTGGLRIPGLF